MLHMTALLNIAQTRLAARQHTRYITVSCEPVGSGQLVSVMSSYVHGPDCLGREPTLLLLLLLLL